MTKHSNLIRYSIAVLGILGLTLIVVSRSSSNSLAQGNPTTTKTRAPTLEATIFSPDVQQTGLPPLRTPSFTPSKTAVPSTTPTFTPSPTSSPTLTLTSTPTPTTTSSPTPTATLTNTSPPTATETILPSDTPFSPTVSFTDTIQPTETIQASNTPQLFTETVLPVEVASQTVAPSSTSTLDPTTAIAPTETETAVVSQTPSNTDTPTSTSTPSPTQTITLTSTLTATATLTETSTITPSPTITLTATYTPTPTLTNTPLPPVTESTRPSGSDNDDDSGQPISPLLLILGGLLTLGVGGYMVSYAMNAAAVDRYARGFVINRCPVCETGHLDLEERFNRILYIPRVKRTVRCDNCRSVLREVGKRKWRYAVDPAANPNLYRAMNNNIVHENELFDIAPDHDTGTPEYIDE